MIGEDIRQMLEKSEYQRAEPKFRHELTHEGKKNLTGRNSLLLKL